MIELVKSLESLGAVGILTEKDLPKLTSQRRKVLELMLDGRWHTGPEIVDVANGSEGLRRLRELRDIRGLKVERRRVGGTRTFEYQLVRDAEYHDLRAARAALA